MSTRRVLIASMSVGGGHGKAGECVAKALGALAPDSDVRIADLRDYAAGWFRTLYIVGYLFIVRHVPWLWGFLYRHPGRRRGTLPPWLLARALRPFERLVREFQPDAILATQITAAEAAAALRRRGVHHGAVATVVTDFDSHPSWPVEGVDLYFVPDEAIREGMVRGGMAPGQVVATGVPIGPAFEQPFDAAALKAKHGIRPGVPVVLMMGGSLGLGSMEATAKALVASGRPVELVIVTGHNGALRHRLEKLAPVGESRLHVLGFIDYVAELMAVSDLFVSKPGGLSMSEALALAVPTLAIDPLPGQEVANARHLAAMGVVERPRAGESLAAAVERLLDDGAARERLAEACRSQAHSGAARTIASRLMELMKKR